MAILSARDISVTFIERTLFENVSFDIEKRDKVGFIGSNGTGKTTLLKVLSGELAPTKGDVYTAKDTKVGYMHQHVLEHPQRSVTDELLCVFDHLKEMELRLEYLNKEMEKGENLDALIIEHTALLERFEREGGLTYKSRAKSALLGLGFTESDMQRPSGTLSGGQASKLSLARLLLSGADILLLDEPTNHLDIESVRWLEQYIKDFQGTVIIVSHDRYFLDAVTNKTIELAHLKTTVYTGNYTTFIEKKQREQEAIRRKFINDSKEIKRIEGIVEQQKRWGREHNFITAASKQKEADRIKAQLVVPDGEEETLTLKLEPKRESGNDVLIVKNLSKSFDTKVLFKNVDMHIRKGERVFILGGNGTGKTTLFNVLTKKYDAVFDELTFGARVDMGYFDQMQSDLNVENTPVEEISDAFPSMSNTQIRTVLGRFLLKGDNALKKISTLSGGERARVALLKLMLAGSNFLLLDEPTNHLDTASREALEDTLLDYDGTMLIISHDRYFINKLATRILELKEDGVKEYLGNYDYYAEKQKEIAVSVSSVKSDAKPKVNDYKLRKEEQAKERKRLTAIRKAEELIEELDRKIAETEEKLSSDEVISDYEKLVELTKVLEELQTQQEEAYSEWESLQEQ
ncbi:MAG: ABC-F family ATP-binding cassette domain-containing protein [Clostridia bacterium]|nr:ABC-F family ATP-binding cassette domain-containing protein [Clostridia bacterium]